MACLEALTSKFLRRRQAGTGSKGGEFAPVVAMSGRDIENYFAQVESNYKSVSNSFQYYRSVVDELKAISDLHVRPLCELSMPVSQGMRAVGLRHDVDADPRTALRCARYLAQHGMCGSFYLLHTAPYYGEFYGDTFVRTAPLGDWVRGFIVAGCELGLHNDALGVYTLYGRDGIQALRTEIAWLRSYGVRIRGTVAHNSGPVYGAENYEIFSGLTLWPRTVVTGDHRQLPLGRLNPDKEGLMYEGTFARPKLQIDARAASEFFADRATANIQSESWMKRYLLENPSCDWGIDYHFWLLGKDRWVIAGRYRGDTKFEWDVDMHGVARSIAELPEGSRSVLLIHPELVGGTG